MDKGLKRGGKEATLKGPSSRGEWRRGHDGEESYWGKTAKLDSKFGGAHREDVSYKKNTHNREGHPKCGDPGVKIYI